VSRSEFSDELLERLTRYVRIDTQSTETSPESPSSPRQLDLLRLLSDELRELGAHDVTLTEYGVVLATIPATVTHDVPVVAFLAHVDTTPDFAGTGVEPIVHRGYAGGDIVLPGDPSQVLSPARLPYLASKVGDDIVTASGTTLLGADDKAGVAIAMTLTRHLLRHPDLAHGEIRMCFTCDEEIGRGIHRSLPGDLRADVAYTLDGGSLGEVVCETFSADRAAVTVRGVPTHPGDARGSMVNALHLAAKIVNTLPRATLTPEVTGGREGFIHVHEMRGTAAAVELDLLLRDFDNEALRAHGELLRQVCAAVQATEPRARITCDIRREYRNMRYWLEQDMRPVELAMQACRDLGIEPVLRQIRGGTDGSRLTELGIPTPDIFTGMQNIHGPLEWISAQDMARATEVAIRLARLWTEAPADWTELGRAHSARSG
jgi:tripeptide aminopeptidase